MTRPATFGMGCDVENSDLLLRAVAKTVLLARAAGFDIDDLLELLGAGLTTAEMLETIMLRLTTSADSPGVLGGGTRLVRSRPMVC